MTTKLTLTIQDEVIQAAKAYAAESGRSLSDIVENYLKSLQLENKAPSFSPKIKKLKGIISFPVDFDHKKVVADALTRKYLDL